MIHLGLMSSFPISLMLCMSCVYKSPVIFLNSHPFWQDLGRDSHVPSGLTHSLMKSPSVCHRFPPCHRPVCHTWWLTPGFFSVLDCGGFWANCTCPENCCWIIDNQTKEVISSSKNMQKWGFHTFCHVQIWDVDPEIL